MNTVIHLRSTCLPFPYGQVRPQALGLWPMHSGWQVPDAGGGASMTLFHSVTNFWKFYFPWSSCFLVLLVLVWTNPKKGFAYGWSQVTDPFLCHSWSFSWIQNYSLLIISYMCSLQHQFCSSYHWQEQVLLAAEKMTMGPCLCFEPSYKSTAKINCSRAQQLCAYHRRPKAELCLLPVAPFFLQLHRHVTRHCQKLQAV